MDQQSSKSCAYGMACWRYGGKSRNIHLGSCEKMDEETDRQKTREKKAKALGVEA